MIYHLSGAALPVFAAAAVCWCLLWLLLAALLMAAAKMPTLGKPIWLAIILVMPWILLKNCGILMGWTMLHWLSLFVLLLPSVLVAGLFFFRRTALRSTLDRTIRLTAAFFSVAALLGVVMLLEFCWFAWQVRGLNPPFRPAESRPASAETPPRHGKVIWILLDELSYQQVYERRFRGVELPAFDQLKAQSTVFANVTPAGVYTEIVVPSLFTGLPTDLIRVSSVGQLEALRSPISGAWQPFDAFQTVFQDARNQGYRTGAAGWVNPYCRILPQVLDRCFWVYRDAELGYLQSGRSFSERVGGSVRLLVVYFGRALRVWRKSAENLDFDGAIHIADYENIRDAAETYLTDPSLDFVFVHMPIPHPGGIYDRRRKTLVTSGASYLDNLVLADQYLAHVRLLLEQQHEWDSSAVIVTGDHSWRTKLIWSSSAGWTEEDTKASRGGLFDDRPAYIVKMPMQQNEVRVDARFQAVKTRALLDAILNDQLRTGEDVKAWVEQNP